MKDESLSNALADTVASPQSIELTGELAEFTLDQAIGSEVLKDVPVVGWLAKGLSAASSISDRLLFNKILRFLTQLESLNSKEKAEFTAMVRIDRDYRRRVGERLILALDRVDEPHKLEILAKCFDLFLTGHLDYEEFSELAHVVDRAFLPDIRSLSVGKRRSLNDGQRMAICGLATAATEKSVRGNREEFETRYQMSQIGLKLRTILKGTYRDFFAKHPESDRSRYLLLWDMYGK